MIREQLERLSGFAGLLVFFLGTVFLLFLEFIGMSLPSVLTRYGSFLLVLVTLGYVLQNGQILREAKKERELTRQSLIEVRKGPVVQLIVQGIDPILSDLRDDNIEFDSRDRGQDHNRLTYLGSLITFPDDEMTSDIERKTAGLNDELREYEQTREQYREGWFALRDEIEEKLPRELNADTQTELVESLQEVDMGHKTELENFALERIDTESGTLANLVLDPAITPDMCKGWVRDNLDHVRMSLQCIWQDENFADEFDRLEDQEEKLKRHNAEIRQKLDKARDEFKQEWEIWESEIRKESQENADTTGRLYN